ncbi:ubiquinol oxidase subunit II [Bradyrhizobium sp. LHD-71]|uniref:ubiquinol oxidase subunit II n=1 Tax=Bradyrhizobium sp. LHD-71 TaxID=3072141 RepID=UPI00280D7E1B|nr:ubiquinol oxidase subunit II [Bradyrhizobium sp. LHD-71]MDQ8726674.1 ubiquinol oxidase subunit II [Bradyrhizobium sp. LHD-71]
MLQNFQKSITRITIKNATRRQLLINVSLLQCESSNGMDVIVKQAVARRSGRAAIAFGAALLVSGCDLTGIPFLDPKGPIAQHEHNLLVIASLVMLIVIIPVFLMTFLFAWRYRASNTSARYTPDWSFSAIIDGVIWLVPAVIVVALGALLWSSTHGLDPYKRIDTSVRPLDVEVVAQDWKWLFIYPEHGIATVNQLVFPSQRPLALRLTSDTVMNSFFIPPLGGQIYVMAGMQTRLHLLADAPGQFMGRNAQYSGSGFSNQHFQAIAEQPEAFEAWVSRVKQSSKRLDADAYRALAVPSSRHPVTYYSTVEPNLFDNIIAKYGHGHAHAGHAAAK